VLLTLKQTINPTRARAVTPSENRGGFYGDHQDHATSAHPLNESREDGRAEESSSVLDRSILDPAEPPILSTPKRKIGLFSREGEAKEKMKPSEARAMLLARSDSAGPRALSPPPPPPPPPAPPHSHSRKFAGSRVYGRGRNRTGGPPPPFIARVKRFDLQFRRA